jgi:hypothetical protein
MHTECVRRKKLPETSIAYACLLAAYPVGIVFFDWLTHDWPNLPWQLGGYAALLLIATLSIFWSRWRAARGTSASTAGR